MDSGERFNRLLGSLEAIKDIRIKTAISDFDSATIGIILPYKIDIDGWQDDYNNELMLYVSNSYVTSINFSDGVTFGDSAPLIVDIDKRMKAFVQVIDVVKKYFKEGN